MSAFGQKRTLAKTGNRRPVQSLVIWCGPRSQFRPLHPAGLAGHSVYRQPEAAGSLLRGWFVEFDHISIGVADEKKHGAFKFNRFGDSYVMTIELTLNCFYVGYL